ncbi:MAG: hypothetical protein MI919_29015, partial [Holophagales bacterium]|nr:hypothetical protein [Holophagales bacterium]
MPTTAPPLETTTHPGLRDELRWLGIGLVSAFAVVLTAFAPTLGGFFLSDDLVLLERVAEGGLFATWGENHGGFLRPVVALAFAWDHQLWGLDPRGFRLTNLILHAL